LAQQGNKSGFPTITTSDRSKARHGRFSPARIIAISIMLFALIGALGTWTSHAVWKTIVEVYTANLTTILDADITALEIWVQNEIDSAKGYAEDSRVRHEVASLVRLHRQNQENVRILLNSEALQRLQELALPQRTDQDYRGFVIVARDGTVIAASESVPYVGMSVHGELRHRMERVFAGEAMIQKPRLQGSYLDGAVPLANRPLMFATAPIRDPEGEVVAAFCRALNPDKDFTRILSVARMGSSGDTYAFDSDGFLLSDSRFEAQLKKIGLIPDTEDARSILTVQIRDPGGDMTRGYRPTIPLEQRPLTHMAAAAIAGQSGVDLGGYRDYRGVMVIGAWRWLPKYGFGVATEIRRHDAFAGHRSVKLAFVCILLTLVLASGWFLYSSLSIHRLKSTIVEIRQLGQYRLLEKIGEGGMGSVFRARHALLKRPTAVKFIRPEVMTEEMIQRFEREVQLTSSLTHPNTIQIYDYGQTEQGIFYYAMEYLKGITLAQLVELDGTVCVSRVVYILKHVCYSLEEAHGVGLIHRDIKPMNIMLCRRGGRHDCVKVLDFGLAKELEATGEQNLTTDQGILGTPAYIAPERLAGHGEPDIRADFYSLGAVAYNLLTGEDVFVAPSSVEVCYHAMKTEPIRPSVKLGSQMPLTLEHLVMSCLSKKPEERPAGARAIIDILDSIATEYPWGEELASEWWRVNSQRIALLEQKRNK